MELPTLDELLARYPRATVERWAQRGYRSFLSLQRRQSATPAATAARRALRSATSTDLDRIRDLAMRLATTLTPTKEGT